METEGKSVYVLYGSQTGNSKSLSEDFTAKLVEDNVPAVCLSLNEVKNFPFKEKAICILIVCSTTGNADCPENADVWWRSVKVRSLAKDYFQGLPFAVLGLGDTNYDKFCHMGKVIDKRFEELGGKRMLELHCADEATGLEETVEAWKLLIEAKVKEVVTQHIEA